MVKVSLLLIRNSLEAANSKNEVCSRIKSVCKLSSLLRFRVIVEDGLNDKHGCIALETERVSLMAWVFFAVSRYPI